MSSPSNQAAGVQIIVNRLFGPAGDDLVGLKDVSFDGHPAITVGVRLPDGREGLVHLSPIHGDERKAGMIDIEPGTKCVLFCPVSGKTLDKIDDIDDQYGASYYALYRTNALTKGAMVLLSDVWGHYHSRVIDEFEIIAHFAKLHDGLD